ncbi:MAG: Hpt domain-containing protein [Hyphomicrobium sp.]
MTLRGATGLPPERNHGRNNGRNHDRQQGDPQASPALAATDPIDRAHLARYTLGNSSLEHEILGLFVAQLPLTVESLRFAETDRQWQVAAHTLKGSAQAVGAWKVARLAHQAEKICTIEDRAAREEILNLIDQSVTEVELYMSLSFPV